MSTLPNRVATRSSQVFALACGALLITAGGFVLRVLPRRAPHEAPSAAPLPAAQAPHEAAAPAIKASFASDAERERARSQGLAQAALGEHARALEVLVPVYQARPDDDVALAIAEASLEKRDFRTAETVLRALAAPDAPNALRVRGLLHEQANQLNEALALYERALPGLAQPLATLERRARVLGWLARFDESHAAYAALAANEAASVGLRQRCRVRMAELTAWKKDLDGALAQLRQLLTEDPKLADALLLQGQILEWQGRYADAKQSYSSLLAFDAANAEARLRLDKLLWVK